MNLTLPKTRTTELSDGEDRVILARLSLIQRQYHCVTDRRTDGLWLQSACIALAKLRYCMEALRGPGNI